MKKDYLFTIKSGNKNFTCINEVFDDGQIIHHNSIVYDLMDDPYNTKLRTILEYSKYTEDIYEMKVGESKKIMFNGELLTVTLTEIQDGGYFKEDDDDE